MLILSCRERQGWRQEFSDGGLTLPTRGLKCGFQGTINAKNLRKNRFSPSDGGLACSDGRIEPPSPPLVPPLDRELLPKQDTFKVTCKSQIGTQKKPTNNSNTFAMLGCSVLHLWGTFKEKTCTELLQTNVPFTLLVFEKPFTLLRTKTHNNALQSGYLKKQRFSLTAVDKCERTKTDICLDHSITKG